MELKSDEHVINHEGEYYIGTTYDFMRLCVDKEMSSNLRKATKSDIELYAFRNGWRGKRVPNSKPNKKK